MNQRVLITGASGALGPQVVGAFSKDGYAVRTFSLDVEEEKTFPSAVESILGDITHLDAVDQAMIGVDYVVHMAALLHINNPSEKVKPAYRRINVEGTRNIVQAALRRGVRRIVYFSTIAVYGSGNGDTFSERSPVHPETPYAATKLEGERLVLEAYRPDGLPLGTVLRLAAVYGVRLKGNYYRLLKSLAKKKFIPIGNGQNRRTLVYDRDVAAAAVLAMIQTEAAGRIFNVTDGRIHSMREIIETLSKCLGRKPPRGYLPPGPVRILARGLDRTAKTIRVLSPNFGTLVEKYLEDMAVDGSSFREEFGFAPRFDLFAGWAEVVRSMRQKNEL